MAINANEEQDWEVVEVFGKPALFTCGRIDPKTVPAEVYKYDIRHDDECQGNACEIARFIMVNHWGSVLMLEPLDLGAGGYLLMTDDDINYGVDECKNLTEFIEKYGSR